MANEVEDLKKELGNIPKDLRRALRPGLRLAGNVVAEDAKRRASWSARIPRATRVSVTFSGRTPGVSVVVNRNRAPHARPFEHGGGEGTFRHPVYGRRGVWVSQVARPFLAPALTAKGDEAAKKIADVVDVVVRQAVR